LSVEVQAQPTKTFIPRLAYYLALLYGGQLREGDGFENLCHAYAIAITKFRQFPEHDQMQSVFRFQEATCGMILGQPLMEMHFVELPKYMAGRERRLQTRGWAPPGKMVEYPWARRTLRSGGTPSRRTRRGGGTTHGRQRA